MENRNSVSELNAGYWWPNKNEPILRAGGFIEYRMPHEMIENLLVERSGADEKKNIQQFLCDYVNSQYNLLGTCIRVVGM